LAKTCTYPNCERGCYGDFCLIHKPRKFIETRTPIKKKGRVGKETDSAVAKWKRTQKPNHQGYYICYISGCPLDYLMAEHPYSKTRHPGLRATQKFEPVSAEMNELKGSMDIEDFLEKYPEYKATVKQEYLREK